MAMAFALSWSWRTWQYCGWYLLEYLTGQQKSTKVFYEAKFALLYYSYAVKNSVDMEDNYKNYLYYKAAFHCRGFHKTYESWHADLGTLNVCINVFQQLNNSEAPQKKPRETEITIYKRLKQISIFPAKPFCSYYKPKEMLGKFSRWNCFLFWTLMSPKHLVEFTSDFPLKFHFGRLTYLWNFKHIGLVWWKR